MNEHVDFEYMVAGHIADEGVTPPSDAFYDELLTRAGGSGQRPEWLALIKEPPMRTNNHLAVGSPTVRVAAILAATMLLAMTLAAAGAGVQRLLAADGPIVVAQDGSGTVETIAEAVAMAEDGDEILVRPGTYTESVEIDADIIVRGDGPVEDIIIAAPEEAALYDTRFFFTDAAYAIALLGTEAELSNLTFSGLDARVVVDGGAPLLSRLVLDDVGEGSFDLASALVINGGAAPMVQGNTFRAGGAIDVLEGSTPLIEDNTIASGQGIFGEFGDGTIIRGNRLETPGDYAIEFHHAAEVLIEGNTIAAKVDGIRHAEGPVRIVGNTIEGSSGAGISISGDGGEITGNTFAGNGTAIRWSVGSGVVEGNKLEDNLAGMSLAGDHAVTGNEIRGGQNGLLTGAGQVMLEANTVEAVEGRGIAIGGTTQATLRGNRSCDNGQNLFVDDRAQADVDDTNEICEDGATE